jgi:hypothetical protein
LPARRTKDLFFGSKDNVVQGKACLVARVESEMARLPGIQVAEQPKAAEPEPNTGSDGFFAKMKRMKMERQQVRRLEINCVVILISLLLRCSRAMTS